MQPSNLKVVGQSTILALVIFVSSFFVLLPYVEHLALSFNCVIYGGTEKYLDCIARNLDSWPYNYILAGARTLIEFVISLVFGFLFTKSYVENRLKNIALLALATELLMIFPSMMEAALDITNIFSILLVYCALFSGILMGNSLRRNIKRTLRI